MERRQDIQLKLNKTLSMLKKNVDDTMMYLESHPEDSEYAAKVWSSTIREFMSYGMKRSETENGENLFKKVTRMFLFTR